MTYFLVLPAWLLAVLAMGAVTVAVRVVPRLSPAYRYAWRVLLWSSIGFVVANGAMVGLYLLVARADTSGAAGDAAKVGIAAALFLGPVVASAVGFVGGAAAGAVLAWRSGARRRGGSTG